MRVTSHDLQVGVQALETVQVFMELIKMVKILQILPKNSASNWLLPSFLNKIWKNFPHFSFIPEYLHSLHLEFGEGIDLQNPL